MATTIQPSQKRQKFRKHKILSKCIFISKRPTPNSRKHNEKVCFKFQFTNSQCAVRKIISGYVYHQRTININYFVQIFSLQMLYITFESFRFICAYPLSLRMFGVIIPELGLRLFIDKNNKEICNRSGHLSHLLLSFFFFLSLLCLMRISYAKNELK